MLLKDIQLHSATIGRYAERYINDGSPSGFSERNSTSAETSPFGLKPPFKLSILTAEKTRDFGCVARASVLNTQLPHDAIFVHPDMHDQFMHDSSGVGATLTRSEVLVAPTASGRTVQFVSAEPHDYVKLHYAGVLGRMRRELPFAKAIAGPETSAIIENAIAKKLLPPLLHVLPEPYARIAAVPNGDALNEWGMVYRSATPIGANTSQIAVLLPCFALFSVDRLAPHHPSILAQILQKHSRVATGYFMESLILPMVDMYFMLLRTLGLQAEWNAQNLLFGFSRDFEVVAIVMRDLESVDKDISLMRHLGLAARFESAPYKCIHSTQYNYQIKHSFMYDFKLGESVLRPLFAAAANCIDINFARFASIVGSHVSEHTRHLPDDFFPKAKWYSFERVLVDQSRDWRPYVEHGAPAFRL
jgi:hypothetical protein